MLDIYLLGTPRVFLDERKISIPRKTTRSLLFYLAMHPHGVARAQVADILWGHLNDESKERENLRRHLNFLRNAFPNVELLENYHGDLKLNPTLVRVDALVFAEVVERIRNRKGILSEGQGIPFSLYQDALIAIKGWSSGVFIDSRDMDKIDALCFWREIENVRLQKAHVELLTFLAEMEDRLGQPDQACLWAERALALDPYEEDAHVFLLKNLRDLGDVEKAQAHYKKISEDFGNELSEKLKTLGESLHQVTETSSNYARPVWAVRPSLPVPFVGQENILQRIKRNYHHGVGTLLLGEAGAGKTRLVREFYLNLPFQPSLLLVPCFRGEENLPYQPWIDMLRHNFSKAFWQKTPAWWTKPLTMLLPELHEFRSDLEAKPGDVFVTALVFEAFKNLLIYAHKESSCLLFVDDAQWMDQVSISLLKYLIQQSIFTQWNIGLVVTAQVGWDSELTLMQDKLEALELERLTEREIEKLAFYSLQEQLPAETLTDLHKKTGGNPFFLLETLDYQYIQADTRNLSEAPPSVKQLIASRLENLSPHAREVLEHAAIQGNHFSLAVLENALDISIMEMTALITELEDARLVHPSSKKAELHYAFSHEKVREEIEEAFSPAQLRFLHKKIADVLEKKSGLRNTQAAILAEHYEKAGEFEKAFAYWVEAAKHDYQLSSNQDAHIAYLRAEKLLEQASLPVESIYQCYVSWQTMLFSWDKPDILENVMEKLLNFAQKIGSQLLIGTALDGLSDVCMARNQFEKGLDYTEEALTFLIMEGHVPAQMNAFIHQGVFLYMLNHFPDSIGSFQTVLELGKNRKDPASIHAVGHAYYQMATSYTGMGYPLDAISYAKKSLHAMRLSGVPHSVILPHSIMGLANYYLGLYDEGKEHSLRSLAHATETNTTRMMGYASAYAAMNETEYPDLGSAWQHAHQAIALGEQYKHTEISSMGYKVIGDIYARLDDPSQAVAYYQRGVAVDEGSFAKLENMARLGITLSLLGDPKGDAIFREALFYVEMAGLDTIAINAKALQLSIFIAREEYDLFFENVDDIQNALTGRSHPQSFVWIDYLHALLLSKQDNHGKAIMILEKTLPLLEEIPFFWIRFRAYKLYSSVLRSVERDSSKPDTKVKGMLKTIETSLGVSPLQDAWQNFSEKNR